jgi:hypothetical protein
LTRSRPFLTVLYDWKTDLRSEYSLVPNQALYQAEPQPEVDLSTQRASRRGSYFAYFAEDGKEFETRKTRSGGL